MSHSTITFIVLGVAVVMFVSEVVAPEIVAVGAALVLYATGVIGADKVAAGFGDPAVIFIASMFVISEALDGTGVTAWAGESLIARFGESPQLLIVLMLLAAGILAALITPNGAAAALIPVVVVMSRRIGRSPSRLLMPLAFSTIAGSLLVLTGSPVNVLVSEASARAGVHSFSYLSFALVGVPALAGTIVLCLTLGRWLIPQRRPRTIAQDLSRHAQTLAKQYELEPEVLAEHMPGGALLERRAGAVEVVVPPRSEMIGEQVFPGMSNDDGDLVILAIQRAGDDRTGNTTLAAGDTLLLGGAWNALDAQVDELEVIVVDEPQAVRRQAVPLGPGAKRATGVLLALVVVLMSGQVPPFVASLTAACAMIVLRVMPVERAYRSISWTTVILVGAMFAVSAAVRESGAAEKIANVLVQAVGGAGPHMLLIGLFVITAVFGQLISNTATALIVIPIAVSAATELSISPRPVLMSIAVAASAAFLTPIATPANLMVQGPGGYRFSDYWKLGLCLVALFFVIAVWLVPVFWSFH